MATHAPGPWVVNGLAIEAAGKTVCIMGEIGDFESGYKVAVNAVANARLIAAAPELLAACEAAITWVALGTARIDAGAEAIENAKADLLKLQLAIAKAGGEPGRGLDESARAAIARAKEVA